MMTGTKERVARYLALLVRCEEAVGGYYRACAGTWPGEGAFWRALADEEAEHALRLGMIQERIRRTPHGVGLVHAFPEGALQAFVDSVEEDTVLVNSGLTTMGAALINARNLALSLIGSQPLRGLSFDDPRFEGYRQEFVAGILRHAERIIERIKEEAPEHARPARP